VDSIYNIAWQCPYIGGPAVFTARSLYSLLDDTTYFDDEVICVSQGYSLRSKKNDEPKYNSSLYSNPAHDKITLSYDLAKNDKAQFIIYNSLGALQIINNLTPEKRTLTLDTYRFNQGVYTCVVQINGSLKYRTKLVIIK
jgi:hypothetical protein